MHNDNDRKMRSGVNEVKVSKISVYIVQEVAEVIIYTRLQQLKIHVVISRIAIKS